jgi:tetratricopeptide (TPR) repeat protein
VPIDREKVLAVAQKYVEKKKYDRAIVEYQKVIQEDPNDARTLLKIGDLQSKLEDYAGAVSTYDRVGRFYASQGFSLKAIAVYKQIREIVTNRVPQLEDRYSHVTPKLAELYQQLGLTSDALTALDEVATHLQRQGRDAEAGDVFRKIVELDPSNPLPHLRLAEALSRRKDANGAVAEFAVAAGQLSKAGRRDDALKVFERLLQHRPEPVHARAAAELYLGRNGSNDGLQALAKLQICFQANPRDLETLSLLARAFNHIGQAAKAIEVQKEMARIARDGGQTDLFNEIVARLLQLAPDDETVHRIAAGSDAPAAMPEAPGRGAAGPASRRDAAPSEPSEASYEDVGDMDIDDSGEPLELSRRAQRPDQPVQDEDVALETKDIVEHSSEPPPENRARVAHVLGDAASFRRARLPAKAVAALRTGLKAVPASLELREVLRDVLLEWGRVQDAIVEMLQIAGIQVDNLDVDGAVRTLQDMLAIEPHNAQAVGMLRELGYELVEEPGSAGPMPDENVTATERYDVALGLSQAEQTASAPLPAYDLEEVAPDEADEEQSPRGHGRPAAGRPLDDIDEPFPEAPLPSFPLDSGAEVVSAPSVVEDKRSEQRVASAPPRVGAELEAALDEAEFFASRGLYDDARTILGEQLARLPNHPLLLERLAEFEVEERGVQGGSGTRPSPAAIAVEDRAFDIAESLGALDATERPSGNDTVPTLGGLSEQVDVEEVFAKFKEGVAKQIGVDDAQSHYDLGVAYKEMGLLEDACREFDTAARDPRRACVCHSMIGTIHLERGNINEAIDAFGRGLLAPDRSREQEASLNYEIGAAYEVKKMTKQALDHFQRVARTSPGFRDVQERIRRLQKAEPKPPARAVAVGADDEFERAFDDILGKGS